MAAGGLGNTIQFVEAGVQPGDIVPLKHSLVSPSQATSAPAPPCAGAAFGHLGCWVLCRIHRTDVQQGSECVLMPHQCCTCQVQCGEALYV
jgi:hypothetical protein